MAYHKKLHRLFPKQVKNLDGSNFTFMSQEDLSESPILRRRLDRPCQPLGHCQDVLRVKLTSQLSKSFNDLDVLAVIQDTGKDHKILAGSTSSLVENQETLPKPVIKNKKTLCGYFKKLIKHSNAKFKDSNDNNPQSEDRGSGKSNLSKFKHISKSVNCLFDRPLYEIRKKQNKKDVTGRNKVISHWLDTGRVPSDDQLNTRSETKGNKKSKGNRILRMIKDDDNESSTSVRTKVLFKQKYGVSSYEIDSDFDGEVTDTTFLYDSEDDQDITGVTTELQRSSVHDSTQPDDCCPTASPAAESDNLEQLIREHSVSLAEYLQTLPTGDHEEDTSYNRPASSEMEESIKKLRRQLLVMTKRTDHDDDKTSNFGKDPSSTELFADFSRTTIRSNLLVRSPAFRYPDRARSSKVTSTS